MTCNFRLSGTSRCRCFVSTQSSGYQPFICKSLACIPANGQIGLEWAATGYRAAAGSSDHRSRSISSMVKADLIHGSLFSLSRICFSEPHHFPERKSRRAGDSDTSNSGLPGERCSVPLNPVAIPESVCGAQPRTRPRSF